MKLDAEFVDEYTDISRDILFCGDPIHDMTREQLIAVATFSMMELAESQAIHIYQHDARRGKSSLN